MKSSAVDDESRPDILILGYGNRLRGDDALGPEAAAVLTRRLASEPRVMVQSAQQLTLDFAETISHFRQVILIDARQAEPVGEIFIQEIQPAQKLPQPFSHYLHPEELLGVCQNLYGALPSVVLTGINAGQFEIGESISPIVRDRLDHLLAQIEAIVRNELL